MDKGEEGCSGPTRGDCGANPIQVGLLGARDEPDS